VPTLVEAETGINPMVLELKLVLDEQDGSGTTDIGYRPARFEEEVRLGQYQQVHIRYGEESVATLNVTILEATG
jgi:hypothetical protein